MKRALSLFLAALMIITMIPLGAVVISADDVPAEGYSVAEVDGKTVYTIYTLAGWNAIAAQAKTFAANDKVVLAQNIGGTEETPLPIKTLAANVEAGFEFDGQGNAIENVYNDMYTDQWGTFYSRSLIVGNVKSATIKNLTLNNVDWKTDTNGTGLLFSRINADGTELMVDNVDMNNVVMTAMTTEYRAPNSNAIYGRTFYLFDVDKVAATITFRNCDVLNSDIVLDQETYKDKVAALTSADNRATAVFFGTNCPGEAATQNDNAKTNLSILDCSYSGSLETDAVAFGGAIGHLDVDGKTGGHLTIDGLDMNLEMTAGLSATGGFNGAGWGGVIGKLHARDSITSNVSIANVKVRGSMVAPGYVNVGGIIGSVWNENATENVALTLANCDVAMDITVDATNAPKQGASAAGMLVGVLGKAHHVYSYNKSDTYVIENCKVAGSITATNVNYVGGIAGLINATVAPIVINNCDIDTAINATSAKGVGVVSGIASLNAENDERSLTISNGWTSTEYTLPLVGVASNIVINGNKIEKASGVVNLGWEYPDGDYYDDESVFKLPAEGYSVAEVDGKTVYTIYTLAGWNAIADQAKTFAANDKVVLARNIGGTEKTPLPIKTLAADIEAGFELDGQGYAIENVYNDMYTDKWGTFYYRSLIVAVPASATIKDLTLNNVDWKTDTNGTGLLFSRVSAAGTELMVDNVDMNNVVMTAMTTEYRAPNSNAIYGRTFYLFDVNGVEATITFKNCDVLNSDIVLDQETYRDKVAALTHADSRATAVFFGSNCPGDAGDQSAKIKTNLNILDCSYSGSLETDSIAFGGAIGHLDVNGAAGGKLTIDGLDMNLEMTAGLPATTGANGAGWGGVIGKLHARKNVASDISITNVKVRGSMNAPGYVNVGGIIGSLWNENNTENFALTLANCDVAMDITVDATKAPKQGASAAGMLVGALGKAHHVTSYNSEDSYVIENCRVAGSITATNVNYVGGIAGIINATKAPIVINNCEIDTAINTTGATGVGVVSGIASLNAGTDERSLTISNCLTSTEYTLPLVGVASNIVINGNKIEKASSTVTHSWDYPAGASYNDESLLKAPTINGGYAQVAVGDGSYAIRFIALSHIAAPANAKWDIVVKVGDVAVRTFAASGCEAYDKLSAYNAESGAVIEEYTAADFGAEKFLAVVIKDVPMDGETAYTFEVTVSYTTVGGVVISDTTVCNVTAAGAIAQA